MGTTCWVKRSIRIPEGINDAINASVSPRGATDWIIEAIVLKLRDQWGAAAVLESQRLESDDHGH